MTVVASGNEQINRLLERFRKIGASMDGESQSTDLKEAQAPERLLLEGTYRIIDELGTGAHGTVYKAMDEVLHRQVAIKIVNDASLINNPHVPKHFAQEAKVLSTLHHENVVQIFRTGLLPDKSPYLVMEYLEGETLAVHMKHKKLSLSEICQIARAVSAGMEHIHSLKVVHRDLKPENVMVNESNYLQSKILDFGISKIIESDASQRRHTTTVPVKGTCAYMSPEQAKGEEVDERSDIYSFTCMFFEMLTTETPFSADSAAMTMMKHIQESAPRLEARGSQKGKLTVLTKLLNQIIDRGLEKDRATRYQTFTELIADLNRAQELLNVENQRSETATFVPDRSKGTGPKRKNQGIMLTGVALATAIILFGWNQMGPLQDSFALRGAAEKSIEYFPNRIASLLKKRDYTAAASLIDRTMIATETWSKSDRDSLLWSYFQEYSEQDQNNLEIRNETRTIAITLFNDLLHWGRDYHRKQNPTKKEQADKDIWLEKFESVAAYLLDDTERHGGWEQIASVFANHPKSISANNPGYYKTAALLRLGAEENCPQKCGVDTDILSEHCVNTLRIIAGNQSVTLQQLRKISDRLIVLLKKRGQQKDLDLLHCELAIYYLERNRPDLALEQKHAIPDLGENFGSRTDEVYPYMLLESLLGLEECKKRNKAAALSQLKKVEGLLLADAIKLNYFRAERGIKHWERYQKLIALPSLKGDPVKFIYPKSKDQLELWDAGLDHGFRLRRAIMDTFGKDSVKNISPPMPAPLRSLPNDRPGP